MIKSIFISLLVLFIFPGKSCSGHDIVEINNYQIFVIEQSSNDQITENSIQDYVKQDRKYFKIGKKIFKNPFYKPHQNLTKDKFSAIVIVLLTGPLGGHRLYLGTSPVVPIVYAVTLGGGIGILPIIYLLMIAITKDLNQYIDNDRVIMWIK